jgi:hypothetical protein
MSVVGSVQVTCKNWGGQTVYKYGARLRTMMTIHFPVVYVVLLSAARGFWTKNDHTHERDNAHVIITGPGGC